MSTSRSHPYTHVRTSSQSSLKPTTVLGDGSGPSPYSGVLQTTSPFSKPSVMQPSPLPVSVGVDISLLPPPDSPRDYGGTDAQNSQNLIYAANTAQNLYHPPHEPSGFSQDALSGPCFPPGFTNTISHHAGGPFPHDDPFPMSHSPDSTDDSVNPSSSSTTTSGSTTLPHVADHPHPHPLHASGSFSSSPSSRPERTARRRRSEPPRDQRATTRLFDQRKSDDENTEALYKLFVPPGAEVKWKKDRLGISERFFVGRE